MSKFIVYQLGKEEADEAGDEEMLCDDANYAMRKDAILTRRLTCFYILQVLSILFSSFSFKGKA